MAVLGRTSTGSALSETSTTGDARQFDATHMHIGVVDKHGLTVLEHRAALRIANAARNHDDLLQLLGMCGLLGLATSDDSGPTTAAVTSGSLDSPG